MVTNLCLVFVSRDAHGFTFLSKSATAIQNKAEITWWVKLWKPQHPTLPIRILTITQLDSIVTGHSLAVKCLSFSFIFIRVISSYSARPESQQTYANCFHPHNVWTSWCVCAHFRYIGFHCVLTIHNVWCHTGSIAALASCQNNASRVVKQSKETEENWFIFHQGSFIFNTYKVALLGSRLFCTLCGFNNLLKSSFVFMYTAHVFLQ